MSLPDKQPFQDDLQCWRGGDGKAFNRLFEDAFADLCKVATRLLGRYPDLNIEIQEPMALVTVIWETYRKQKTGRLHPRTISSTGREP